ncbi:mechanosensitive ion channel [Marivirga sp. S37H4]|uniref:Mechanosensitive ion channel n=1 Tax=Marivirga aurantiaca TaxID=2802615 RepID=A0A934WXC6_9BACT|nr:mechanosensitive ion channel domain-containing protein [Marivirga aurantiaca]MBK6264662.1 mechanosensitive ion channel [Marivirga aurantiaca]
MISLITQWSNSPLIHFFILAVLSFIVGLIIRFTFFKILHFSSDRKNKKLVHRLSVRFKGSIFLFIPAMILLAYLPDLNLSEQLTNSLDNILEITIIVSFTIIIIRLIYFIQDVLLMNYDIDKDDNIKERQAVTQINFLRKLIIVIVSIIAISLILLQFDGVRKYGATLLTSAGVAGIIIGFAAQKTIGNLMAGFQIAFTQPIKIGDAVIVENEWGWVEEINLTYVVIKVWDLRRLVVPITYFTEKTFQNWTRNSADIMGSVFLFTDYTIPIAKLREAFDGFLEETPLWDGKAKVLQVVDCTERTMQLRLLMTAKNSPTAWDLRCFIREKMLVFIQENYPDALPKTRVNIEQVAKTVENKEI